MDGDGRMAVENVCHLVGAGREEEVVTRVDGVRLSVGKASCVGRVAGRVVPGTSSVGERTVPLEPRLEPGAGTCSRREDGGRGKLGIGTVDDS